MCVCPRGLAAGRCGSRARGGAEAGQLERERPSARLGEREKPPPPKIGVGYGSHVEEWGEKDDPYGLIALIKITYASQQPSSLPKQGSRRRPDGPSP